MNLSRRRFLQALGVTAGVAALPIALVRTSTTRPKLPTVLAEDILRARERRHYNPLRMSITIGHDYEGGMWSPGETEVAMDVHRGRWTEWTPEGLENTAPSIIDAWGLDRIATDLRAEGPNFIAMHERQPVWVA